MVQEFRYLTPGGLMIFYIVLGFTIVDPELTGRIGVSAAVLLALITIPVGWICYQWYGYLSYRRGGLEVYHETMWMHKYWHESMPDDVHFKFMGDNIVMRKERLGEILLLLGEKYYRNLDSCMGKSSKRIYRDNMYMSCFHDFIFMSMKEHDHPRGMYGIHNTLTVIYHVCFWGVHLITTALLINMFSIETWLYALIAIGNVITIAGATWWLVLSQSHRDELPGDYLVVLAIMYSVAIAGGRWELSAFACTAIVLLTYLAYKSMVPWKMLKIEAELREEFLSILYAHWLSEKVNGT